MILNIILFLGFFLLVFIVSFICLMKRVYIIDNLYLIIPAICIVLWAIFSLIHSNFSYISVDFMVFYRSGQIILHNPKLLYEDDRFLYMPSFAILFAISLSLLPVSISVIVFLLINYFMAVLSLLEYNKILTLMNLKEKIHRFLLLMIISNGFFVYYQFVFNQTKYILFFLILVVIRRELQSKKKIKIKDLKYFFINYSIFAFAIGIAPYFLFLLLIYIFHDIPYKSP